MEMHYNKPVDDPIAPPVLDFHRFVLLVSHRFTDRIHFFGELELEHALVSGLEDKGELELEQAYLDILATPELNFRAGMLLAPMASSTSATSRRLSTASNGRLSTPSSFPQPGSMSAPVCMARSAASFVIAST